MAAYDMKASDRGTDYSANALSLTGYSLIKTIPAQPGRIGYFIQSLSTGGLRVSFEGIDGDGNAVTPTIVALDGPAVAGGQGGWINSAGMRHNGIIKIYAPTASSGTDTVAARTW